MRTICRCWHAWIFGIFVAMIVVVPAQENVPPATPAAAERSVTDLFQFVKTQVDMRQELLNRPAFGDADTKALETLPEIVAACDEILAISNITEKFRLWTLRRKAVLLDTLTRWKSAQYAPSLRALAADLEKYPEELRKSSDLIRATLVKTRLNELAATPTQQQRDEDFIELAADFVDYFTKYFGPRADDTLHDLLARVDRFPRSKRAILLREICPAAAAIYQKSRDAKEQRFGRLLLGIQRRSELVGSEMMLKGYTLDGKPFNPEQLRGKVVLVDFWATWCRPCLEQLPAMHRLHEKYSKQGFEILGVSVDENINKLTAFAQKHEATPGQKITWPIIAEQLSLDKQEAAISEYYGISDYPAYFLIGRDGKVVSVSANPTTFDLQISAELKKNPENPNKRPDRRSPL